jgi:hypothetical protein
MGTPLTGSSVASTYTGLLKTSDNATLTASLKTVSDGGGNDSALQLSTSTANINGNFSVGSTKFTADSSSGNISATGTANITGAATVGSLSTAGNIATSAGTISSYGAISQTQAAQNNSLAGNLAVGGNLNVTGATTLSGNLSVPGTLSCTGDFAVNTNKFNVTASSGNTSVEGTLGVTGASSLSSLSTSGAATVGTTLGVTGNFSVATNRFMVDSATGNTVVAGTLDASGTTTLAGNLLANGNTTIGNANTDTLIINSDDITLPNVSSATIDYSADTVLIRDNSASNKVRAATATQFFPQCVQQVANDRYNYLGSVTAPGTEISSLTKSITPKSASSKVLVSIVLNYSCTTNSSQFVLFRVTRNGTEIGTSIGSGQKGIASGSYEDGEINAINNTKIEFLDSPSSSISVEYKVYVFTPLSATSLYLNYAFNGGTSFSTISSMTLQEFFA